jgi:hypothetical protein
LNIRSLLTRTGTAVLAVSLTAMALPAQTAPPAQAAEPDERFAAPARAGIQKGVPSQLGSRANPDLCLTFVAAEKIPMAVMLPCNPAPTGHAQYWTYTEKRQLKVTLSTELMPRGACLDTGADLVTVPAAAPVLVLPCRNGAGQRWRYDESTGAFVNAANGQALSSLPGLRNQASPVGVDPASGNPVQRWQQLPLPLPDNDLFDAIMDLLNGLLKGLGLNLPLPIGKGAHTAFDRIDAKKPVPAQMSVLPRQILELAR